MAAICRRDIVFTRKLVLEFLLFGIAGIIGFVVDAAILHALAPALGPFIARIASFLAAVFATWLVNRYLTFRRRQSTLNRKAEFSGYLVLMLGGGAVNYAVYSTLVVYSPLVREYLVLGVAAGSLAGMLINFALARFILFRYPSS